MTHAAPHFADGEEVVTRFAPSPTGRMHAGNIYASLVAWVLARRAGGRVVLRIEDLDRERSKQPFIDAIMRDYEALGLTWDEGPFYQHDRDEAYREALHMLQGKGLVYPCFCTRADLHASSAPHPGEKLVYPGTCRDLSEAQVRERMLRAAGEGRQASLRLRVRDQSVAVEDVFQGRFVQHLATECGDFLVRRSDGAFAYQLAVVVDDAAQGVNLVVRGVDLLTSTPQQVHLKDLLGLSHPRYAHVPLLVTKSFKRLSKRDHDASLDEMLQRYGCAAGVLGHIAHVAGMVPHDEPMAPEDLVEAADLDGLAGRIQIRWRP